MPLSLPIVPTLVLLLLPILGRVGPLRAESGEPGAAASEDPDARTPRTVVRPDALETPASSVLTRERLGERAGADLPAALQGEPSLHVPRLGGLGSYATVSIRGSSPEQVLVALDDIPLNPADGAPVDLSTLPLGPLDHAAIYRGRTPWSLGVTGLGGAVRLSTRAPRETTTLAELVGGSFSTAILRASIATPGLVASFDYLGTGGDFRYLDDGGTAWTADDDRETTRRNAASTQLSGLLRTSLVVGAFELSALDVFTRVARGLPSLGVTPTRESALDLTRNLAALRVKGPLGPLAFAGTASLSWSETVLSDPLSEIGLAGGHATTGSLVPSAVMTVSARLSPGLQLATHASLRHELTTGDADAERTIGAFAGELHARFEAVTTAAGVRLERGPDLTGLAAFAEAALSIAPVRLHVAVHRTPRLPSLFELTGNTGLALGNPTLTPEALFQAELGARLDLAADDWRLSAAITAHAGWADDLIQFVQNAQGVARPENVASARLLGLEVALELTLFDQLELRSTLALLDARDTSDIAARTGKRLPLRPPLTTTQRLAWTLPVTDLGLARGGIGVALDLDHLAGNPLDAANLVVARPRTMIGVAAFARSDTFEARLSLFNVTAQRAVDLVGYPLPGQTAMATLRWGAP